MTGRMESVENLSEPRSGFVSQRQVSHPSHRPLEIAKAIPTFPQPRRRYSHTYLQTTKPRGHFYQDFHFDPGTGTVYTTPLRTTRLSQAEHCASPSPVAASVSSHRSQTLIERVEPRSGRDCSLQNGFEPKAVDPRPVKATRLAAAAPRSCAACQRTAAGSDAPPPAATSSSGHA